MDFAQAIKSGFKNYAVFGGVASRSEFWFWILFTQLVSSGLAIIQGAIVPMNQGGWLTNGDPQAAQTWAQMVALSSASGLSSLWGLAVLSPTLAVGARRLRDADKSPHLLWLYLAPMGALIAAVIGLFIYAVGNPSGFCLIDGCTTGNSYSGWIIAGMVLLGVLVLSLVMGILFIVWFAQPSKTAEQGNKYVAQQPSMAAPIQPIEPGTTA